MIYNKSWLSRNYKKKSSTSNPNIYETLSHSTIYTIFWKCITRPFKCIYVNCFDRLIFLAEVSTKLQKIHFSRQLTLDHKDHNSGNKHENRTNDHILLIYFFLHFFSSTSALTVCNIHFWIWKYSKFIFMWSPFGPFWSVKYLNFWPKAIDLDSSLYSSRK